MLKHEPGLMLMNQVGAEKKQEREKIMIIMKVMVLMISMLSR